MKPELKTSEEWMKEYECKILDYDGWDRANFRYSFFEERILRSEFENRVLFSTVDDLGKLGRKNDD